MKLLFVVNNPDFFLSHRGELARAAQREGYEIHVATPAYGGFRKITEAGFVFHPIYMNRSRTNPFLEMRAFLRLWKLYRDLKPEIVHHVTIKPVLYGGIAARLARVPAVVHAISGLGYVFIAKGIKASLMRSLVLLVYRASLSHRNCRVIFQNPDDLSYFVANALLKKERAVLINGSGADTSVFRPGAEKPGSPIVMFASRLLWDKGVREFAEAAQILCRAGIDARFVLVGSTDPGNPTSVPEEWITRKVADGLLEWWGHRTDMQVVLSQATIVCLPSYREGLPKVLIEAAACARPIVTTNVPGCKVIVRDGINGVLVPPMDCHSLAEGIRQLLGNPSMRDQMGKAGRKMVEAEFSLVKVIEDSIGVYANILNGPKTRIRSRMQASA